MKLIRLISVFAFILASGTAFAAAPGKIAVDSLSGNVAFVAADGSQRQVAAGEFFGENTRVVTDADSTAKLVFGNGTVIALKPGTTIEVSQFEQNNPEAVEGKPFSSFRSEPEATSGSLTTVRLVKGTATFKVAKLLSSSRLTVKTRAGDIVVKGTTFSVTDDGSFVTTSVVEGEVAVSPSGRGTMPVSGGKSVAIPVSAETGAVGTPSFRGVPATEREEILDSVTTESDLRGSDSTVLNEGESDIGADPELPAYAENPSDPTGGVDSIPSSENSPASL